MDGKYNSQEFAKLLGISKSSLLDKERKEVLPPARREAHGAVNYRYYLLDDIPVYRKILKLAPRVKKRRQLFINLQRGSGKSAVAANYAYYVSTLGIRCLALDLDPLGGLTASLGKEPEEFTSTIGDALLNKLPINWCKAEINPYLDLIPANSSLISNALDLNNRNGREFRLAMALDKVAGDYELIVMDINSHPDILTLNALMACDELLIPVSPGRSVARQIDLLFQLLTKLKGEFPVLSAGKIRIFLNGINKEEEYNNGWWKEIWDKYSPYMLKSMVHYDARLSERNASLSPLMKVSPNTGAAGDIKKLADELLSL